ncbi:hypothetical protein ACSR0Z_34260 [Streptomyces viridosporus]
MATRILSALAIGRPACAFLAHGYAYLPVPSVNDHALYLRMAAQSVMTPWPVDAPSVVLTIAGTVDLEVYQEPGDMQAGRPQYARSFGTDLEPAVVTLEGPGSTYTLGDAMVHQAVMEPDTVTLFVRGPRRKKLSHAAQELMPPRETWPAPAIPGDEPEESRPPTLEEYQTMRAYLIQRQLIDWRRGFPWPRRAAPR